MLHTYKMATTKKCTFLNGHHLPQARLVGFAPNRLVGGLWAESVYSQTSVHITNQIRMCRLYVYLYRMARNKSFLEKHTFSLTYVCPRFLYFYIMYTTAQREWHTTEKLALYFALKVAQHIHIYTDGTHYARSRPQFCTVTPYRVGHRRVQSVISQALRASACGELSRSRIIRDEFGFEHRTVCITRNIINDT